jgi:hypothetical protein
MSLMSDLQSFEKKLVARIKELQAHVTELEELRALAKRLGVDVNSAPSSPRRRGRAASPAARGGTSTRAARGSTAATTRRRSSAATTRRRGAAASGATGRRASGRRDAVLATIQANPNIRVRDVAQKIGVKDPTSLYRVIRQLETDGKITKKGPLLSAR